MKQTDLYTVCQKIKATIKNDIDTMVDFGLEDENIYLEALKEFRAVDELGRVLKKFTL